MALALKLFWFVLQRFNIQGFLLCFMELFLSIFSSKYKIFLGFYFK